MLPGLYQSIFDFGLNSLGPPMIFLFDETPEGCKERLPPFRRMQVVQELFA